MPVLLQKCILEALLRFNLIKERILLRKSNCTFL